MKKTKLRKQSNNPIRRLKLKADRLLQDYYRQRFPNTLCEGCGCQFNLMHHFVLKSHSNRLRFDPQNLIPLCKVCHSKVHGFHGELIVADIIMKRGRKWLEKLRELEREKIDLTIRDLVGIIEQYSLE